MSVRVSVTFLQGDSATCEMNIGVYVKYGKGTRGGGSDGRNDKS